MGESDRYFDYKQAKIKFTLGDENNALVALLTLNIVFFLLLLFIKVIYFVVESPEINFQTQTLAYFSMPANLSTFITQPWTIITQMFCHTEVSHILSNMIWLWAFGYILQELTGNKKIVPIYIYGGLAGGIAFIAANYLLPPLKPFINEATLLGANASVMAVAVATTALVPNYKFLKNINGGIPLWVLTAIYVIIDIAGVARQSPALSISHIAGGLAGFLFIYFFKRGYDGSSWMNNWYNKLMNLSGSSKQTNKTKDRLFYNTQGRTPYTKTPNLTQQRVDEILDKINKKGFQYLTAEEKNILKRASEEDL